MASLWLSITIQFYHLGLEWQARAFDCNTVLPFSGWSGRRVHSITTQFYHLGLEWNACAFDYNSVLASGGAGLGGGGGGGEWNGRSVLSITTQFYHLRLEWEKHMCFRLQHNSTFSGLKWQACAFDCDTILQFWDWSLMKTLYYSFRAGMIGMCFRLKCRPTVSWSWNDDDWLVAVGLLTCDDSFPHSFSLSCCWQKKGGKKCPCSEQTEAGS